jgi:hypothetical protein
MVKKGIRVSMRQWLGLICAGPVKFLSHIFSCGNHISREANEFGVCGGIREKEVSRYKDSSKI